MMITVDSRGRIAHLNRAAKDKLGLSSDWAVGRPFAEALSEPFGSAQGKAFLEMAREGVLRGRVESHQEEVPNIGPSGMTCRAQVLSLEGPGSSEGAGGAVIILLDESDRAALEEADTRMLALQDLTIRLLGHDLKAPIQVIQGAVELEEIRLKANPLSVDREALARDFQRIRGAIAGMMITLENARAISRLATGGAVRLKPVEMDMSRLAHDCIVRLQPLSLAKRQVLEVRLEEAVMALAVPGFESVVQNLLDNAIKYAPQGGGIALTLRRDGGLAVFEVADTGPGVPAEKRGQLFKRFQRLEEGTQVASGHGLGLSIVAALVDLSGGALTVGDRPDGRPGAYFKVALKGPP